MVLTVCANPSVDSFWSINQINKGTINRSKKESFYPGGKGIHVAFALQELGTSVTTLGIWGGMTGGWIQEQCKKQNIATIGPIVDNWTRICITNKSSTKWNETEFLGAGPSLTSEEVNAFISAYKNQIKKNSPEAIVLSGSVPSKFDNNIYKELTCIAKSFDIPAFIDAKSDLLEETLQANPFSIHINKSEGRELTNIESPHGISEWLQQYCSVAAVTAGKEGLYIAYEGNTYHAFYNIEESKIISTIGSGDCLLAGLCKAILTSDDIEEWAQMATACGSANCIHPKLGMLKASDVNYIHNYVSVQKI